ncbi:helix-turn-helix domain-containing protein [Lysinibacillus sp. NPDC097287]|uniref:helix-turn-helix domain-containing protein n=1 Tax=Lysinibacillus sp. NPDC097287 TaxID=3364144 RepID=UPI003804D3BE
MSWGDERAEIESYPLVLTAIEISQILKISKPTAYELMNRKDFPLIRIGRSKRVLRSEFFSWLSKH